MLYVFYDLVLWLNIMFTASSTLFHLADPEAKAYLLIFSRECICREPGGRENEDLGSEQGRTNIKMPYQTGHRLGSSATNCWSQRTVFRDSRTTRSPNSSWGWEPGGKWRRIHKRSPQRFTSKDSNFPALPVCSSTDSLQEGCWGRGWTGGVLMLLTPLQLQKLLGQEKTDTMTQPWGKELWACISCCGSELIKS